MEKHLCIQNVHMLLFYKLATGCRCSHSLFASRCVFRMFPWSYGYGRQFLCVDYMVFNLRLIHIFAIHRQLGPKIIILSKMVRRCHQADVLLMFKFNMATQWQPNNTDVSSSDEGCLLLPLLPGGVGHGVWSSQPGFAVFLRPEPESHLPPGFLQALFAHLWADPCGTDGR